LPAGLSPAAACGFAAGGPAGAAWAFGASCCAAAGFCRCPDTASRTACVPAFGSCVFADPPPPPANCFFTSAGFSPLSAIRPSTAPTGAFCPSATATWASVPDSNASISITALSVSTSAMGSPALTASPSFFRHRTTVPSVIVSLNCCIVISAGIGRLSVCGDLSRRPHVRAA
jgi:hypothetical protein